MRQRYASEERRDLTFDTGLGVWIKSKEIGFLSGAYWPASLLLLLLGIRLAIYITLDFYKISYIPLSLQAQDSRKSFCGYAAAEEVLTGSGLRLLPPHQPQVPPPICLNFGLLSCDLKKGLHDSRGPDEGDDLSCPIWQKARVTLRWVFPDARRVMSP